VAAKLEELPHHPQLPTYPSHLHLLSHATLPQSSGPGYISWFSPLGLRSSYLLLLRA
jgi:hypothetical protein